MPPFWHSLLAQFVACGEIPVTDGLRAVLLFRIPGFEFAPPSSGFQDFRLDSWMDMPILIMQPQGDATAAAPHGDRRKADMTGEIAYVFGAGAGLPGALSLRMKPGACCISSKAFFLFRFRGAPPEADPRAVEESGNSGRSRFGDFPAPAGSSRIHRLGGGHGNCSSASVNNGEDCGPEDDEACCPVFTGDENRFAGFRGSVAGYAFHAHHGNGPRRSAPCGH